MRNDDEGWVVIRRPPLAPTAALGPVIRTAGIHDGGERVPCRRS